MQFPESHLPGGSLELLQVSGPDAVRLLQGQLTCDVGALASGRWLRGAACNNKGRVLATFLMLRDDAQFLLVFNPGVRRLLLDSISKFLPFYKCTLHQPDQTHAVHGVVSGDIAGRLRLLDLEVPLPGTLHVRNDTWAAALGNERYLLCLPATSRHEEALFAGLKPLTPEQWLCLELEAGHFPFAPEDHALHTPQELHLDRMDYVSFTKGCYTGQEIVARMHYRGKPKKQLYLVRGPASQTAAPSTGLYDAQGTETGTLLKQCPTPTGLLGLAQLPLDRAWETGTPTLHDAQGNKLACTLLPDALPRD